MIQSKEELLVFTILKCKLQKVSGLAGAPSVEVNSLGFWLFTPVTHWPTRLATLQRGQSTNRRAARVFAKEVVRAARGKSGGWRACWR
jgi:hypothetical protein